MYYLINLIISTSIFYLFYTVRPNKYGFAFASVITILFWTALLGSQYNVGTDYQSYLTIFSYGPSLEYYKDVKKEYGFYYMVKSLKNIGLDGQDFFYVFYLLTSLLFFKFTSLLSKKNVTVIIFLFITVSSLFHYQLNGLRQCTAVFFVSLSALYYYKRRFTLFIILFVMGVLMHKSAIMVLPILFLIDKVRFSWSTLYYIVIFSAFVSLISFDEAFDKFLSLIGGLKYLDDYTRYSDGSDYVQDISLLNKITKLVYLPFYLYIIKLYNRKKNSYKLSSYELSLFYLGVFSYIFRNVLLISSVTNRLGLFFTLLSIIPLYFLINELIVSKKRISTLIVIIVFSIFYLLKIIVFPVEVYDYKSIFFY